MRPRSVPLPCAIALALLVAGCERTAPERPDETRVVRVLQVGEPRAGRSVEFPGEIRARHETRLAFRVGGIIRERLVEVGSAVRAGQPIARIDATDLALAADSARAEVATVEAERALAEAELARYKGLLERKFISQAEFDRRASVLATAGTRLESARARERQAENLAGYALLVAPVAGVVTAIEAEAGQVVAAAQTVARLAQPGEKEAVLAVPESERAFVRGAQSIVVRPNAMPGRALQGKLRELAPDADPVTRTYAARVSLAAEERAGVELGMSVRVTVTDAKTPGGIELPPLAIHARGEIPHVWIVGAGNTVRQQAVETAGVAADRVLIRAGLRSGDLVVIAGAQLLREGQKVRVLDNGAAGSAR